MELLNPIALNSALTLNNKIIMAPMTRREATDEHCVSPLSADYYSKRASAGLIITEGTLISPDAIGYGNVPGIYTAKQIEAWRAVTQRVHAEGGKIFCQLWHCGRVSHRKYHGGRQPLSASATDPKIPLGRTGLVSCQARAADLSDSQNLIDDYQQAAQHAMAAGFDGVEIHGANGYLIDQFLHACSNYRQDEYGGTTEARAQFCLHVVNACCKAIGAARVGLRLSPAGHMAGISTTEEDAATFGYLLSVLSNTQLAYVHTGAFDDAITYPALGGLTMTQFIRQHYTGHLIACGGYDLETGNSILQQKLADMVAYGRPFLANPDLISKIKKGTRWLTYTPE